MAKKVVNDLNFRADVIVRLADVLSATVRVKILMFIAEKKETSVTEMGEQLGINQATLSHHLSLMKAGKVVESSRDSGRYSRYTLGENGQVLVNAIEAIESVA